MFLVKKEKKEGTCQIQYFTLHDEQKKEDKLDWFRSINLQGIPFTHIQPDKRHNWINIADSDFEDLLPLHQVHGGQHVFHEISNAISTNRDEWVYDKNSANLTKKINFFIREYNGLITRRDDSFPNTIKWSSTLKSHFAGGKKIKFRAKKIVESSYRPFFKIKFYSEKMINDRLTEKHLNFFGKNFNIDNWLIAVTGTDKSFCCLSTRTAAICTILVILSAYPSSI